jgi:FkbM family methyltransferase
MASSQFMRLGRCTRYLPRFRGLTALLGVYRRFFPSNSLFRVDDFDGDLKLDVSVCETIGINIWHTPELFEQEERKVFCSAIDTGTVVLDVGANIGIYTLLAAKRGARVFAIEADPDNARALRHHIEINDFSDRVTVFEMAATDRAGMVTLYRNSQNSGGSTLFGTRQGVTSVRVEGRTIDSLELPPIDVCKMDIEGAEALALCGMTDTLTRSPNLKLLTEWNPGVQTEGPEQDALPRQLLSILRARFASVSIVGGSELSPSDLPPPFCNLWAHR